MGQHEYPTFRDSILLTTSIKTTPTKNKGLSTLSLKKAGYSTPIFWWGVVLMGVVQIPMISLVCELMTPEIQSLQVAESDEGVPPMKV